jgi:formylglycine-generating enzyme required for sulfatase activity
MSDAPHEILTSSLGSKFIWIEPGTFQMGSPEGDYDAYRDEKPRRTVILTRGYYLAIHQVTRGQFAQFLAQSGYRTNAERERGGHGWNGTEWRMDPHISWRNPGFAQTDDHPVVVVSHNDAMAFIRWLGEQDRCSYRLPTEAEWEYACRAGTTTRYFTGDEPASLEGYANVADASAKRLFPSWTCFGFDDGYVYTSPVGSFKPNPWGLCDMIGNVWEWCSDWWDARAYMGQGMVEDPAGPKRGTHRVFRGGCWRSGPRNCRSAYRNGYGPAFRIINLGFRLARDEPESERTEK